MRLSLEPIYDSGVVAVVLIIGVVALLIWVTPSGTTPPRRRTLLLLRSLAALALVLTLVRPALVRTDNRPTVATLIIAADSSRSMTLGSGELASTGSRSESPPGEPLAGFGSRTRWQQQTDALDSLVAKLGKVDGGLNVALYQYDQAATFLGSGSSTELPDRVESLKKIIPVGNLTDLGIPLRVVTDSARTTPLAGIALLSDGTQTSADGDNRADVVDPIESARMIGAMGVPIWTLALGPESQAGTVRDVAILSMNETYRLFSGNEAEIAFEVSTQGYAGREIPVTLTWRDSAGTSTVAATRTVTVSSNQEVIPLRLPIVAPQPGQYRLTVEAKSPSGETDTSNNRQLAFVDVQAGGGRVLYLEGTPRLEQMFLRRAVRRFPDLEISYRWIPRDTSKRWPIDLSDDLQSDHFDIVILGDLHSAALGDAQAERLTKMISEGTALVTLGGEHAYGPGGYARSPLARALPVELDETSVQPPGVIRREAPAGGIAPIIPGQTGKPFQLRVSRPHPITNIAAGGSSWETLPKMPGANLWTGVKISPGVQSLLEDENERPMMVVGEFGKGRVASIAFDSTWTWWRGGANEFHRRFWRQLMLWLLSRDESDDDTIQVELASRRFVASSGTDFSAALNQLVSPNPTDVSKPRGDLVAEIVLEDGTIRKVDGNASVETVGQDRTARIRGALPKDLPPGIHVLQVRLKGSPGLSSESSSSELPRSELSASVPFQVIDDTRELVADRTDHALLERIASATSAAGGEAFRTDQVDQLVERIVDQRRRAQRVVIEKKRVGDDPISGWLIFLLFAGALSVEWYLRRQWGLA